MLKKCWDIFIGWCFTSWGIAFWSSVGGSIMLLLTYLTTQLQQYAPLSYGIAFFLGLIATFITLRLILSIWLAVNQRLFTKKPTFIEYKIENGRINLLSKGNIYKVPACQFQDNIQVQQNYPEPQNRTQKKAAAATQQLPAQTFTKLPSAASILIHFDKPIHPSTFHPRIEAGIGKCPAMNSNSIDERWSHIVLEQITDNCSFTLRFN